MKMKIEFGDLRIELEGTEEEVKKGVQAFLQQLGGIKNLQLRTPPSAQKPKSFSGSLTDRVESLISEGFFNEPRRLAEIKDKLGGLGYHYPITTIAPTLLFLLRQRELRRIGKKRNYAYVKP